jgi:4'-phosphopantetheinyl transferase
MIKLYLTRRCELREHDAGVALALYAVQKTFGVSTSLSYSELGKPYSDVKGIFISISHSRDLCAAAVSDNEIGADIEYINKDSSSNRLIKLAKRYFSKDEQIYVLSDPLVRFWEIWTAKESFIKFTGEGLSRPLNSFSVFDGSINYNHFLFQGFSGCVCSRETAEIIPIFVDIDEIIIGNI